METEEEGTLEDSDDIDWDSLIEIITGSVDQVMSSQKLDENHIGSQNSSMELSPENQHQGSIDQLPDSPLLREIQEFFSDEGKIGQGIENQRPTIDNALQVGNDQSPDSFSPLIGEIEEFLMKDEEELDQNQGFYGNFFSEVLRNLLSSGSNEELVTNSVIHTQNGSSGEEKETDEKPAELEDEIIKQRRRQLRNRDSAMKSRERKRMYVKDLEMKGKYLEAECRRLENTLRFYVTENQALHYRLHQSQSLGVQPQKQESAVLSLELLLLGSLFWASILGLFSVVSTIPFPIQKVPGVEGNHLQKMVKGLRRSEKEQIYSNRREFMLIFSKKRCFRATKIKMKTKWLINALRVF